MQCFAMLLLRRYLLVWKALAPRSISSVAGPVLNDLTLAVLVGLSAHRAL